MQIAYGRIRRKTSPAKVVLLNGFDVTPRRR